MVAGAYTSQWAGAALGFTRDGFQIMRVSHQEEINETDIYGRTLIDTVHQGGDSFIQTTCRTSNAASRNAFWPWVGALGTWSNIGSIWLYAWPIGTLGTTASNSLALTAVASTPASLTADPATLTVPKAILAPGFQGDQVFSSRARQIPIRLACLPTDSGGTVVPVNGTVWVAT